MDKNRLNKPEEVSVPDEVQIAAIDGRLTFFIGNGVSRLYDIPSWDDLANRMLKQLVDLGKIDYNKYDLLLKHPTKTKISIADHFFKENLGLEKSLDLNYKTILMKNVDSQKYPAYSLLTKFGCRFLTTNYDSLFSDALKYNMTQGRPIKVSQINDDEAIKSNVNHESKNKIRICNSLDEFKKSDLLNKNILVHLHGSISDERTLVASTLGYLKLYGDSEKVDKLKLLLKNQTVVFIGYGLEELELLDLIVRSSRETNYNESEKKRFFLLLPMLTHEYEIYDLLKIYYENQLGIKLLPYSRDKLDYRSVVEIIENWAKELSDLVNAPNHADKMVLLDNLLSEYREAQIEK